MLAVRDHLPEAGLYSSAVARGVVPDFPPTTKTSPLTSRVAVGAERGVLRLPVVVQVPDWPSADRPVPPSRAMVNPSAGALGHGIVKKLVNSRRTGEKIYRNSRGWDEMT